MAALEMAESEKRKAVHDVDIAALVVDELKWIIRNAERGGDNRDL